MPCPQTPNPHNESYLRVKRERMGHLLHPRRPALAEARAMATSELRVAVVVAGFYPELDARALELVRAGQVLVAARLLGAPFRLRGTVIHGDKRGRELGYPTANIAPGDALVPPHGVYACRADGRPAAVSIGVRPTFLRDAEPLVEMYILDFAGDLYGRELTIEFLARLRDERKYAALDALLTQMHHDVALTRLIAEQSPP